MKRHIADNHDGVSIRRAPEFLRIARKKASNPSKGEAFRATHKAGTGARLRAFMKIERERTG